MKEFKEKLLQLILETNKKHECSIDNVNIDTEYLVTLIDKKLIGIDVAIKIK